MIRTNARPALASKHEAVDFRDSIEWEEVSAPSEALCPVLQPIPTPKAADPVEAAQHFNSAWNNTLPAHLVETPPASPFSEPLQGMVMREMNEPEVFRHFFE